MSTDADRAERAHQAVEMVEADVTSSEIAECFPPGDGGGFRLAASTPAPGDALSNETCTAVAWEYVGSHQKTFAGIDPTGHGVTIRAVTIVDHEARPPTLARYVDWLSVMHQLGVATVGRPRVTASVRPHGRPLAGE